MRFKKLVELGLPGKRVLMRVDMNVPMTGNVINNDARIQASLPSIVHALTANASVILMSHLGRPTAGRGNPEDSLAPIAAHLSHLLGQPVPLVKEWKQGLAVKAGEVVMLENVRLNPGEQQNDLELGQAYARLCDIFVNDAFATAHRAEASTHAVAQFAPTAAAGMLLSAELEALSRALANPARPLVAIVGGAKISSKLTLLNRLADKVDQLIVGGGIANTFLLANGHPIGQSLAEPKLVDAARAIMSKLSERGAHLPLPNDVVTATALTPTATAILKNTTDVAANDMILDIGPKFATQLASIIAHARTVVWNGPVGMFELAAFSDGTRIVANAIAATKAFSIAGGGDTLSASANFNVMNKIDYLSTGGGAFLAFLEGSPLPAVAILERRATG